MSRRDICASQNRPACQCPDEGVQDPRVGWYDPTTEWPFVRHEPGACKCTNDIALYRRGGEMIWLCSCCCLPSDEQVAQ